MDVPIPLECREVLHGADWIKVMATGGMRTPGTNVEVGRLIAGITTGTRGTHVIAC